MTDSYSLSTIDDRQCLQVIECTVLCILYGDYDSSRFEVQRPVQSFEVQRHPCKASTASVLIVE